MKNRIVKMVVLAAFLVAGAVVADANHNKKAETDSNGTYCQHGQCITIKDNGYRCKNCCQQGSNYCWSHGR